MNRPIPVALSALLFVWAPPATRAGPEFPGPFPGPARLTVEDGELTVANQVLAAGWKWDLHGLRPTFIRDALLARTVGLTGEVFRLVLGDGTSLSASGLAPAGPPRIRSLAGDPSAARLAARLPGRQCELPLRSPDGNLDLVWRVILRDGANYLRQELDLGARREACVVREIVWNDAFVAGAASAGTVDGSPVVAGTFFAGYEDPNASNGPGTRDPAIPASLGGRLRRGTALRPGETLAQSYVIGVAPAGQMRRAFLRYVEHERAHPYRPFLHYNSWYDIPWDPFALNETNCLDAIRTIGDRFIRRHGVAVDALVFDDGWDDPRSLWKFHDGFPNGFGPLTESARSYGTHLGVWLSPFGGYGEPRDRRLQFGSRQGYETNAAGFSLAGPKYYAAFKAACLEMIRRYRVNHFKFDGIADGMYASGSAQYLLDTEAMRRLMLELRGEAPELFVNLTTGSWPSPFWLRFADSLWRQGGDMGHAGKGSRQQQWLTYRDQEVYRNIVRRGPLFPLNSLMTQGVAYSRHGMAGDPTFDSRGFRDDVRAFFGAGTCLQELYLQPSRLSDQDWKVLAEAARWSRTRAETLVDTHWIGGDPSRLEVYGYASWSAQHGVVMLRNPDDQPRTFELDLGSAFELPPGAPTRYHLTSPWADESSLPALDATAGSPIPLELAPFQVLVLDAVPRRS